MIALRGRKSLDERSMLIRVSKHHLMFPSNFFLVFQFVSRPLIRSVSKTTGGPLIMEGCTIKVPDRTPQFDPNDPKFKFKTFYIQDDTNKVEISYEKIGEKSYKLENLEIKKSSLTNQGLYKCAVEFEGDLQISKKSAYVQYEGKTIIPVSFSRVNLKGLGYVFLFVKKIRTFP